jgi:hypothetical protein
MDGGKDSAAAPVLDSGAYVAPVMLTREERAEKLKRALTKVGPVASRASLREAADKVTDHKCKPLFPVVFCRGLSGQFGRLPYAFHQCDEAGLGFSGDESHLLLPISFLCKA